MQFTVPKTLEHKCKRHTYGNWQFVAVDCSQPKAQKVLEQYCNNLSCSAKKVKRVVIV